MSIDHITRCMCDGCGAYSPEALPSEDAEREARNVGWHVSSGDDLHYCPKCVIKKNLAKPLTDKEYQDPTCRVCGTEIDADMVTPLCEEHYG